VKAECYFQGQLVNYSSVLLTFPIMSRGRGKHSFNQDSVFEFLESVASLGLVLAVQNLTGLWGLVEFLNVSTHLIPSAEVSTALNITLWNSFL
jgi:hypothetical protein